MPVGAPCNICNRADPYASILRLATDGSYEVVARGVRNTVGFDWHPGTGQLWFTENGRDWLGDDVPPDELNVLTANGQHFGYPFCHGGDIADPSFGSQRACSEFEAPIQKLGPHVAALGMRFYTGEMFPQRYRGQIFIAEHGSWNRTDPIGYRVMVVHLNESGQPTEYEEFAIGWLQGATAWGRPVDVMVRDDGSLLVSDDRQGAIYRIAHTSSSEPDPDPPDPDPPPPDPDPPDLSSCEVGAETLCLQDGRFEVEADWWTADGEPASAVVAPMGTDDSGLFRFYDPENWEILIKVLTGVGSMVASGSTARRQRISGTRFGSGTRSPVWSGSTATSRDSRRPRSRTARRSRTVAGRRDSWRRPRHKYGGGLRPLL